MLHNDIVFLDYVLRTRFSIMTIFIKFKDFFNIVILQRGVLGKVEQYYVEKEYQMRGVPHYHILLWI
uniref:Helitron helicase-like domain-containing protein n=1 Tax=Amphimedon queenslandica TaxID=400682 RepID=A0A1X7TKE2_AMPQE